MLEVLAGELPVAERHRCIRGDDPQLAGADRLRRLLELEDGALRVRQLILQIAAGSGAARPGLQDPCGRGRVAGRNRPDIDAVEVFEAAVSDRDVSTLEADPPEQRRDGDARGVVRRHGPAGQHLGQLQETRASAQRRRGRRHAQRRGTPQIAGPRQELE